MIKKLKLVAVVFTTARDSYQILLSSLNKLAKSFDVDNKKTIFPYKFIDNHPLDYRGSVPDYSYFDESKVSFDDWVKYVEDRVWSNKYYNHVRSCNRKLNNMLYTYCGRSLLKDEAIKYCINDCISLHQILIKFNKLFFDKFKININEHPTSFATRFSF